MSFTAQKAKETVRYGLSSTWSNGTRKCSAFAHGDAESRKIAGVLNRSPSTIGRVRRHNLARGGLQRPRGRQVPSPAPQTLQGVCRVLVTHPARSQSKVTLKSDADQCNCNPACKTKENGLATPFQKVNEVCI